VNTPSIFISYRRSDAEGWAGRLSDSLRTHLGHVRIFRDIEEIPPGVDFVEHFMRAVGECDAFIEIIGSGWLTATDANGRRRLDDPKDPTRLEVATALSRNIRVIPVLLEGASMPKAEDLPEDLQALARRNAYPLSDSRWTEDTRKLAEILRGIVQPRRRNNPYIVLLAAGAVVAVVGIGIALFQNRSRQPAIPRNAPEWTSPAPKTTHPPAGEPSVPVDRQNPPVQSGPQQYADIANASFTVTCRDDVERNSFTAVISFVGTSIGRWRYTDATTWNSEELKVEYLSPHKVILSLGDSDLEQKTWNLEFTETFREVRGSLRFLQSVPPPTRWRNYSVTGSRLE